VSFLWDQIDDFLGKAKAGSVSCGFWLVDLDGFIWINDELGHRTGDELLKAVAQSLRPLMGATDLLARAGGDEFMLFRHHVEDRDEALALAEQMRAAIDQPFILPGHAGGPDRVHARITASIGVALGGTDLTAKDLGVRADWATCEAKSLGGNNVAYFGDLMVQTISADGPEAAGLPLASCQFASALELPIPLDIGTPRCAATALGESIQEPSPFSGLRRTVRCQRVDGHPSLHIGGFRNLNRDHSQVFAWRDADRRF
jgi:diguanylate cyclase (GGDEF)-like protein